MSVMTYTPPVSPKDKPLAWLHGELKTPPLSREARLEVGFLLRRLHRGQSLSMPHSRPMPSIGARRHELRVNDGSGTWGVVFRVGMDAIVRLEVFAKRTKQAPAAVIATCQR